MAISKRLRFEVLRRDNHRCRYCGAVGVALFVDHVLPEALGGQTIPENLVAACEPCNSGKSSIAPDAPLVKDVKRDSERWARAMDKAGEIRREALEVRNAYVAYFKALWDDWTYVPSKETMPLDDDWVTSLERFYDARLHDSELQPAIRAAMTNDAVLPDNKFRYFCGICWKVIRELQEVAGDLVVLDIEDDWYADEYDDMEAY